ncbi:hypothetical protein D3C83_14310 [compost metagenome]
MRVVPIGTGIGHYELVSEVPAWLDGRLGDIRDSVHCVGQTDTVPVHGGALAQPIFHHHPQAVALAHMDFRAGRGAVVAPDIGLRMGVRRQACARFTGNQPVFADGGGSRRRQPGAKCGQRAGACQLQETSPRIRMPTV